MEDPKTMQALQLLSMCVNKEISVREAVNIIETVTKAPEKVREILELAEKKGMIKRRKNRIFFKEISLLKIDRSITKIKCEDNCRRCGRKITCCYFISLPSGSVGPFGSECIRKLKLIQ